MSIGGFLLRNSNTEATSLVGKLTLSPVETLDHSNNNISAGERVEIRETLARAVVKGGCVSMDAGRWEYSTRDCIDCSCSKNLGWKMLETGVGFFGAPVRDCRVWKRHWNCSATPPLADFRRDATVLCGNATGDCQTQLSS